MFDEEPQECEVSGGQLDQMIVSRVAPRPFLALGIRSEEKNVVLLDSVNPSNEIARFTHPDGTCSHSSSTFQSQRISELALADDDRLLFSASPGSSGVVLWDLQAERENSHYSVPGYADATEPALYGTRNPYEIHGLCPTSNGQLLVTGTYRYLHLWDTRTGSIEKEFEFYPSLPSEEIEKSQSGEFFMNQRSAYPLKTISFRSSEEKRLIVIGKRIAKCTTFTFPDLVPEPPESTTDVIQIGRIELEGFTIHRASGMMFGADIYGSHFVWGNEGGEPSRINSESAQLIGSGANGMAVNEEGDTIACSMSNPQSGYFWNKGFVATLKEVEDDGRDRRRRRRRRQRGDDRVRCIVS